MRPDALAGFARRFSSVPKFDEGENVLFLTRQHTFFLIRSLSLPLIAYVVFSVLVFRFLPGLAKGIHPLVAVALFLLVVLGWGFWAYLEWENDQYIITNKRIITIKRIYRFYENRQETGLSKVQDVTLKIPSLIASLLGYGDLIVATAGVTGTLRFSRIPYPEQAKEIIFSELQSVKDREDSDRQKAIRDRLEQELGLR